MEVCPTTVPDSEPGLQHSRSPPLRRPPSRRRLRACKTASVNCGTPEGAAARSARTGPARSGKPVPWRPGRRSSRTPGPRPRGRPLRSPCSGREGCRSGAAGGARAPGCSGCGRTPPTVPGSGPGRGEAGRTGSCGPRTRPWRSSADGTRGRRGRRWRRRRKSSDAWGPRSRARSGGGGGVRGGCALAAGVRSPRRGSPRAGGACPTPPGPPYPTRCCCPEAWLRSRAKPWRVGRAVRVQSPARATRRRACSAARTAHKEAADRSRPERL